MNYDPCRGCGGEDCVCCEVWLERQADARYENSYEAYLDCMDEEYEEYNRHDSMYDYGCDYYDEEDDPDDAPHWASWDVPEDFGDWGYEGMREE